MTYAEAIKDGRIASFVISAKTMDQTPDVVHSLLAGCLIVESRPQFNPPGTEYTAYAPGFDAVPSARQPPRVAIREVFGDKSMLGGKGMELEALEFCAVDAVTSSD